MRERERERERERAATEIHIIMLRIVFMLCMYLILQAESLDSFVGDSNGIQARIFNCR